MRAAVIASALLFASTAIAMPVEPIVFDFEDGLQGWELSGSAQRVQTQVLGGEWAIFGDGFIDGTSLAPPLTGDRGFDVTQFRSITVDVFLVEGAPKGLRASLSFSTPPSTRPFAFRLTEPGLRELDLFRLFPPRELLDIRWGGIGCDPDRLPSCVLRDLRNVALIDNITFHPIPEPGSVALLVLGLVGMAAVFRKGLRSVATLLIVLLLVACRTGGSTLTPNFNYSSYPPGSFEAVIQSDTRLPVERTSGMTLPVPQKLRVRATYLGQTRSILPETKRVLAHWAQVRGQSPEFVELFGAEALFREKSEDYWLPVQSALVHPLNEEVRPGSDVDLYALWIATVRERWYFLVNEFQAR